MILRKLNCHVHNYQKYFLVLNYNFHAQYKAYQTEQFHNPDLDYQDIYPEHQSNHYLRFYYNH